MLNACLNLHSTIFNLDSFLNKDRVQKENKKDNKEDITPEKIVTWNPVNEELKGKLKSLRGKRKLIQKQTKRETFKLSMYSKKGKLAFKQE